MQLLSSNKAFLHFKVYLALLLVFQTSYGKVPQTNTPSWVKPQIFNSADTLDPEQVKYGFYYMVIDRQYNLISRQAYNHYAYRVISTTGVQNNSEITLDYNPAYQKIYLHTLKIIRNGLEINSIPTSDIKEIQQEKDLDSHIYDETKTVYIILKDVRPNDIIEYAYTIEGTNPIFKNKSYLTFSPNLEYKLLNFYFRVLKSNEPLQYKLYNGSLSPTIKQTSNNEEWIWDYKNNKAIENEEYIPSWYTSVPFVEISSFSSWAEVEKWGMEVFSNNEKLDDNLLNEIDIIKTKYSEPSDRAIAAVRFVQKQIRYLGIEIGINSHKPASPNKVFQQRYGDCKDKSLLLCKMLKSLGIEAHPALINTWLSKEILNRSPSAMIFNHAVVKANINGFEQWFDPTISDQEGDLQHCNFPNYGYGLVLDGNLNGLDVVPSVSDSKIELYEKIVVENFVGSAKMEVTTRYYGDEADNIRSTFIESNIKEVQKNYLKFYKKSYDSISVDKTLYYTNDTINNIFVVNEAYQINDFWKQDKNKLTSSVYSYYIEEKLKPYNSIDGSRKSPLYLHYPLNIHHVYKITFPEKWSIAAFQHDIKNEYLEFHSNARSTGNICYLEYSLKTFKDYIPAEKSKEFLKEVKQMTEEHHGMTFTYTKLDGKSKFSTGLFIFFLIIIGTLVVLSVWLYKKKKYMDLEDIFHPSIGGWMILPIIGLIITPFTAIYSLIKGNLFDSYTFHQYTSPSSSVYDILWIPYWIFNLIFQAAYIVLPVILLTLIFKYDRRTPLFAKWFYAGNLIINLIFILLASGISNIDSSLVAGLGKDFFRAILLCAIWVPYFHYSKRVKETFIK